MATSEEVNKNIRQMRQVFCLSGVVNLLIMVVMAISGEASLVFWILIIIASICIWEAFIELGKRSSRGYTFATIASFIFVLSFPVYTIFGISYLNKLSKPEMRQVFGLGGGMKNTSEGVLKKTSGTELPNIIGISNHGEQIGLKSSNIPLSSKLIESRQSGQQQSEDRPQTIPEGYFETPRPSGDGLCSDNKCPCLDTKIPRGTGYLYISPELVELRADARSQKEMIAKLERSRQQIQSQVKSHVFMTTASANPILMCEQGARLRKIDLDVAAKDATYWWETGFVPLRATPPMSMLLPVARPPIKESPAEVMTSTSNNSSEDRTEKLLMLKGMFYKGLITQVEYENKKAEINSKM